ncbi:conjugal transfer protein [Streptomyces murinus]|uniref:conjugal transfer protein n=1 Tax=Streptomyces murinus TaxID=33900 RepID=UPI0037BC1D98
MSTRSLTKTQTTVFSALAAAMALVGGVGAWGTYTNAASAFHRQATAAGVVAAGEGLTLIFALILLGRTMLGQPSPAPVRAGLWTAPVAASCVGVAIASDGREAVVYAVTPLAMSGAAEGLGFIARSIVVYTTGRDAEADRRNAATVQQLAYQQALAAGHPDKNRQEAATRKAWQLIGRVGAGDPGLADGLVEVSRDRLKAGADRALGRMLALPDAQDVANTPTGGQRPRSATEALRREFSGMDPVDAIRLAADARPDAPPAELAHVLGAYGVSVDPVAVALVLGQQPAEYTVDRPDAAVAPQVTELPALSVQDAVEEAATALGPDATAREIADHLKQARRLVLPENHIRAALSRAAKKTDPAPSATPRNTDMEGGYA